jgi:hypothetical protein
VVRQGSAGEAAGERGAPLGKPGHSAQAQRRTGRSGLERYWRDRLAIGAETAAMWLRGTGSDGETMAVGTPGCPRSDQARRGCLSRA